MPAPRATCVLQFMVSPSARFTRPGYAARDTRRGQPTGVSINKIVVLSHRIRLLPPPSRAKPTSHPHSIPVREMRRPAGEAQTGRRPNSPPRPQPADSAPGRTTTSARRPRRRHCRRRALRSHSHLTPTPHCIGVHSTDPTARQNPGRGAVCHYVFGADAERKPDATTGHRPSPRWQRQRLWMAGRVEGSLPRWRRRAGRAGGHQSGDVVKCRTF